MSASEPKPAQQPKRNYIKARRVAKSTKDGVRAAIAFHGDTPRAVAALGLRRWDFHNVLQDRGVSRQKEARLRHVLGLEPLPSQRARITPNKFHVDRLAALNTYRVSQGDKPLVWDDLVEESLERHELQQWPDRPKNPIGPDGRPLRGGPRPPKP